MLYSFALADLRSAQTSLYFITSTRGLNTVRITDDSQYYIVDQ